MREIAARLAELEQLGLYRRTRLVSGPQGPHVLLDGKPVLLLCSNNSLGLADHARVQEAAAEAALRWGVGAGSSRLVSGTMTIHRRLEQRLAGFKGTQSALLFGSGYLANLGVVGALQGLAVRAGINGVMMGNFLTTLGNTPEEDRAMFENLGLNVARQADNGANPRPDNRSGWLEGETPAATGADGDGVADAFAGLEVRLWDPSTQLRFTRKRGPIPPRPEAAGQEPAPDIAAAPRDGRT